MKCSALVEVHESASRKAKVAYEEFLETKQSCYCGSHFAFWLYLEDLDDVMREIIADWCYQFGLISTEVQLEQKT